MTHPTHPAAPLRSRSEHYRLADRLMRDGVDVVDEISRANEARKELIVAGVLEPENYTAHQHPRVHALTERMDELGKKAMGIWAQALVHATLATAPQDVAYVALRPPREAGDLA